MADKTVIILRESLVESIGKDVFTVLSAFAMIVPGWLIGSGALLPVRPQVPRSIPPAPAEC